MQLLALLLFAASEAVTPSADELLKKALSASAAQEAKSLKFTYREDHDQYQLNKQNKLTVTSRKTYDVIMLEGENYRKLILVDGKPLEAKLQKKVDADLEKTRLGRRKRGFITFTRTVKAGGLEEVARLFTVKVAGEEIINGRKAWRLEALPKDEIKTASKNDQNLLNTHRTIWLDQQEGFEVRYRTEYVAPTNGFQPGSVIDLNFSRIGDWWLLDTILFKFDLKAAAVIRGRGESRNRFYDYKLFKAESRLVTQ